MAETTTAVTTPMDKKRKQVLESMPAPLQAIAAVIDEKFRKQAAGTVMIRYDIGKIIADVVSNEKTATYGEKAVEKLAAYQGEKATTLYALRDFAVSFNREYVASWTSEPMANGSFLTETHWMVLRMLASREAQEKYLKRALKDSLSAKALEAEVKASGAQRKNIRTSGRKASQPASPLAGLQKFTSLAQSLANFEEQQMDKSVFTVIDEQAPDSVSEVLLERLTGTLATVQKTVGTLGEAEERIEKNIKRVSEILESRPVPAAAEKEAKPKEAKPAGSGGKKKVKKIKKKGLKPAAAVAKS